MISLSLQDEQRLKVTCVEASPVDHTLNAEQLIQEVNDLLSYNELSTVINDIQAGGW